MKYIATKDCFGFRSSFWYKGDVVESKEGETVPAPFKPVEKPAKGGGKDKPETKE